MNLRNILGVAVEAAIDGWVRVLGKGLNPEEHPWLKCPIGSPTAVGPQMYNDIAAAENLEQRSSTAAGLLPSFDDLRSDKFDSSLVNPRIRDFYERTAAYELEVWSEVGALARPLLWGLVTMVSRRMDQLVFPLSPLELSGVMRNAEVVAVAASGIANANPGIDIVRKDPKDAPTIYNTDHYTVVERLTEHPDYPDILKRTKVEDSQALQETLNSWVWIIGPERDPTNHWIEEIPDYIKNAAKKPNPYEGCQR